MLPESRKTQSPDHVSLLTRVLLIASLVCLVSIFIARAIAQEYDGALANVLTLILGFLSWVCAVVGLWFSPWPRVYWRCLAAIPLLIVAITLILNRVTRLDGELIPQFESRWAAKQALPQAEPKPEEATGELIPASALAEAPTDTRQFLGPHRDGILEDSFQLDTNWNTKPPEVLWKQPIGAGWSSFAVQGDVAVTMEQRDDEQWVSAYDVNSGKLYWHVAIPGSHFNVMGGAGPRATPAIANSQVFTQTATGEVLCIDMATGKRVWEVDLFKLGGWDKNASEVAISWGRAGSPLVIGDLVVVPLGAPAGTADRSLVALDKQTGNVRWRAGDDQISYASPSLARLLDKEQIVITNEASVTGHDIESGKVLWSIDWPGHSNSSASCSQTITVDSDKLLISKGYSQGAKLVQFKLDEQGKWSSSTVWEEAGVLKTKFTSAVLKGDYAYALSDGRMECVRVADGKRQWKGRGYGHGQLLLVGNNLLIMAEQGEVALVAAEPKRFTELARVPALNGVTWNVPTLSGNRLLIRNADEAACLKLPHR